VVVEVKLKTSIPNCSMLKGMHIAYYEIIVWSAPSHVFENWTQIHVPTMICCMFLILKIKIDG
jgi:hypothetical protein